SLTGRVPLWDELAEYAAKRPVLGYGYEGFWTPKRIAAIMKSQNWTVQNAHNSYFEVMLQLGFVGLVLAVWLLFGALRLTTQAFDRTRDAGYAFAAGVIVLGMANSGLESLFVKLRFPPTVALTAIMSVALYVPAERDPGDRSTDDSSTTLATSAAG
ncbi:MAG: O-antigen ligase family protein, partial [Planctomycetota bacterium]